ncbi:MAG TPA: TonB family protein [Gammaproteobacteria bacterium]
MLKGVRPRTSPRVEAAAAASRKVFTLGALAAALALGAAGAVSAQDVSPPRLLDRVEAEAPKNAFGIPIEGWVRVRYSVLANGATADVRVVDVMPPKMSTRAVVSAVEKWRFAPATAGGEPIDWHNNESLVVFDQADIPLEPSQFFARSYVQVVNLVSQQDYEKAKRQTETMLESQATRLNEIGLLQAQAAMLHVATSNLHDAYDAILRATDPEVVTLQDPELANALRYRFGIELELGRFESALETYSRLAAIEDLPDDDAVKTQAEALRQALRPDAAIAIKGRVAREPWSYAPTRRTFGFSNVDGSIRGLELECNRRKQALEFSLDVEWSIPESWGACTLTVDARRDTTFTLVEFPTATAASE